MRFNGFNMSEDSKGSNRRHADPNFMPPGIDIRATNSLPHGYKVRECGRRASNQGPELEPRNVEDNAPVARFMVLSNEVDLTSG